MKMQMKKLNYLSIVTLLFFIFSVSVVAQEISSTSSDPEIKSARDFVLHNYDKMLKQDINSAYFTDKLMNDIKKLKIKNDIASKKGDSGCPDWRIFEAGNGGIESYRIGEGTKSNTHVIIPVHTALNNDPSLSKKELEKPRLYLYLINSAQKWRIDNIFYGTDNTKPEYTLVDTIKACLKE